MKARHVLGILRKNWYLSVTRVEKFIDITFWPAFELFMWGLLAIYIGEVGLDMKSFFLGSMFLWMLFMRSAQDSGVYLLDDYMSKSLHNLFITPITEGELFVANILFTFIRTLMTAALLFVFALIVLQFNLFSIDWVSMVVLFIPVLLVGWSIGFLICGLLYRYGEEINIFVWALPWLVQPFSCVFYPLSSLPGWMKPIAQLNPLTYVFEGFRAVLRGESYTINAWIAYIGAVMLLLFALWVYIASIRASRRSGKMARS
jgi:ABC-2 type transport system permease protein